jgi:hypothetical protein
MAKKPRVLLLGWQTTIGSGIAAIPAIHAVRAHFGEDTEYWLLTRPVPAGTSHPGELLIGWGRLEGLLFFPRLRHTGRWLGLLREVHRLGVERAVYVDLSVPRRTTRIILKAFCRLAGLGHPIGLPAPTPPAYGSPHEPARRLANLAAAGLSCPALPFLPPLLPPTSAEVDTWLAANVRSGRRLVAICPGARAQANHWPEDRFIALGERLIRDGRYELVICGGPAERAVAKRLCASWGEGLVAAGVLSLAATARLLSFCDLVVGLDTGTSHLAAALRVPVIVIQGGRCVAGAWDPLGQDVAVLRFEVPCAGCGHAVCPLVIHPCMRGIHLEQVWHAVQQRLTRPVDTACT